MLPVYVNGRFLTQPLTGVQRYACEVLRALDALLGELEERPPFALVVPPNTQTSLDLEHVHEQRTGRLAGHLWEQLDLPRHAAEGVLLSLSVGPARHRRHFVTLHDAGVWANPGNFSFLFRTWYRTLIPMLRSSAVGFFTVSEFSKTELGRYARIPADRMVVTYNGVDHVLRGTGDPGTLARHGLERGGYVLCVGANNPNKNIGLVTEAMARIADPRLVLVNVGRANSQVFETPEAPSRFALKSLGHVSDGELRALYEGALCLAFPSHYEGFGIPPLEAMACGCPTIVARTSALPEACGDATLYCDPYDVGEMAAHLRALRDDAGLRERLRAAGRERAHKFTWRAAAQRILAVLLDAAQAPRQNK